MRNSLTLAQFPEGYIKKRKKSIMVFLSSIYLFCIFWLLLHFNVIVITGTSIAGIISIFITLFALVSICYVDVCKRVYNKMQVPNYNEVSVLNIKEMLIFSLPVAMTAYFVPLQVIAWVSFLGGWYVIINKFNRPYNPLEEGDLKYRTK